MLVKYLFINGESGHPDKKITLAYTTGYHDPFRYGSYRAEFGFKFFDLPLVVWGSHGYNSDLIRYYRNVTAGGIAVEIGAF